MDAATAAAFRTEALAAAAEAPALAIDLSAVAYLDFFGLEALLDVVRQCRGPVTFLGVRAELRDYFRRNDVAGFLRLHPEAGPPAGG